MQATQDEVFDAISEERTYQTMVWDKDKDEEQRIADWCLSIEKYNNLVKDAVVNQDVNAQLDNMRKIAALAVACMEHNGIVKRYI